MKSKGKHALALASASLAAIPGFTAQPSPRPTNFILINLDDAGWGDFSCNGALDYTTPNIDRMAAEGMRFTHFLSAQPISGASRMGLLTGCYPNRIGYWGAPGPSSKTGIAEDEETIGEVLKKKGYHTAIYGKWHLGNREQFLPLQNGFDEYYGLPYSNDMWNRHPERPGSYAGLPTYDGNTVVGYNTDQSRFTTDYTERAVTFIKKHKKESFFIYLAHSMPHVPLAVSDKFKGKSGQGLYGDVMMEIDWSVGEILRTLRETGLDHNTLVILTSDNGPWANYGNHAGSTGGLRQAKATTFEGGNRVPCIMWWNGTITPGTVCNKLSSQIDILPTFAEISGAPLPGQTIDGVSLMPLIKGESDADPRGMFAFYFKKNDLEAVTDGRFKLVFPHRYRDYGAFPPGENGRPGKLVNDRELPETELYDLRRDPGERYNVIDLYPEAVARLEAFADSMRVVLGDDLRGIKGRDNRPVGEAKE